VLRTGNLINGCVCSAEYSRQKFTVHNERPIEYRFALDCLARRLPVSVLDVGPGTTAWPRILHGCGFQTTAIDKMRDYWPWGMVNRHWKVLEVDITDLKGFHGPFDAVTCISVIEHIEDHETAVRNMLSLLAPGGQLIITTPYNHSESCPNVYLRKDAVYGQNFKIICRSSSASDIEKWQQLGARLKRIEMWRLFSGPVWATGERVAWRQVQSEDEPHQLGCFEFEKVA